MERNGIIHQSKMFNEYHMQTLPFWRNLLILTSCYVGTVSSLLHYWQGDLPSTFFCLTSPYVKTSSSTLSPALSVNLHLLPCPTKMSFLAWSTFFTPCIVLRHFISYSPSIPLHLGPKHCWDNKHIQICPDRHLEIIPQHVKIHLLRGCRSIREKKE